MLFNEAGLQANGLMDSPNLTIDPSASQSAINERPRATRYAEISMYVQKTNRRNTFQLGYTR